MILQALHGYYERVARNEPDAIAERGYSDEKISFAVVLDREGRLIDINDLRESADQRPQPRIMQVPASFKRPGTTPRSFFLWDKTAFVFGVTEGESDRPFHFQIATRQLESFKKLHLDRLQGIDDEGLRALRIFVETWSPHMYGDLRYAEDMLDANVVFRLDGELGYLHERPRARGLWQLVRNESVGDEGICLVTGKQGPIARIHPSIKGMPGQTMGGSIVSFNRPAFASYGFDQGENAPVSETAAFAYTTALNKLLKKEGNNRTEIADTSTLFWAEASDPDEAEAAEQAVSWLFEPSIVERDASESKVIQDVMKRMADGRPLDNPELKLSKGTHFYILGLVAPDPARLSVRFWEATTLGAIGEAFHQHRQDLRIEPRPWRQPPAIWRLLTRTAPARRNQSGVVKYDAKQIPPNLSGEMMRAILSGQPYPKTILANAVMRFRSDHVLDGLRVALVKAALVREMRARDPELPKEAYVSLNPDDPDAAYRLGRLFALLEKAQLASIDGINATICDRYYGAAAATPARVFGFLMKNSKNHLAALRKGRGAKWVKKPAATGGWLDREIGTIFEPFKGSFPPSLTLEEQGRFSIGYYHQKYAKREDIPDDLKTKGSQADPEDNAN